MASYLDDSMTHLLGSLKRDKERSAAFTAIGLIAVAVQSDISKHVPRLMDVVRASLPSKDMSQK